MLPVDYPLLLVHRLVWIVLIEFQYAILAMLTLLQSLLHLVNIFLMCHTVLFNLCLIGIIQLLLLQVLVLAEIRRAIVLRVQPLIEVIRVRFDTGLRFDLRKLKGATLLNRFLLLRRFLVGTPTIHQGQRRLIIPDRGWRKFVHIGDTAEFLLRNPSNELAQRKITVLRADSSHSIGGVR